MTLVRTTLVSLLAAGLAACSGGSATTSTSSSSAGTASIDGKVSGASSALRVEVSGTTAATNTDSSGAFALVGVPAGASALHFTGGGVDATLSIQALIDSEHRSLAITVAGNAATEHHEQTGSEFHGKVEASDATKLTLTVAGRTIATSSATRFVKNGAAATFADIKVGDEVEVHGALQADGTVAASAIEDGSDEARQHDDIVFTATLSAKSADGKTLTVGDIPVVIGASTTIYKADKTVGVGDLAIGDHLLVRGTLQPGPSVNADVIRDLVPDVDPDVHVAGKITAIDTTAKTITLAALPDLDGGAQPTATTSTVVTYDDHTTFGGYGSPASAADLKVGDFVVIAASTTTSGTATALLALEVNRLPPPPAPLPNVVELHGVFKSAAADGSSFVVTVPADGGTTKDVTIAANAQTIIGGAGDPKALADFKAGDLVVVKASKAADGSLTALALYRMPPLPPPPPPPTVDFKGTIENVGTDGVTVSGHRFAVNATTQIRLGTQTGTMSDLKVGQNVEVLATAQANATLPPLASLIQVQQ